MDATRLLRGSDPTHVPEWGEHFGGAAPTKNRNQAERKSPHKTLHETSDTNVFPAGHGGSIGNGCPCPDADGIRVNVPLSLAEKVLPAVNKDRLHNGKIQINEADVNGVDLRALLEAVRTSRDGEFVTVQSTTGDVRVAKQAGYLILPMREDRDGHKKRVGIRAPMTVVAAVPSTGTNELDLVVAVRALAAQGDTELVAVKDQKSTVRIWLDSKNESE